MHRVMSLVVMILVLSAAASSAALAQEATPAAEGNASAGLTRTNVRYFLPFTGDGLNAGLTVTGNESGSCVHESLASPGRPDAWNCIGETSNEIFDPCFENPFSTPDEPGELACVDSPSSTDVILFTATAPLPRFKEEEAIPLPPRPAAAIPAPGSPSLPQPTGDKPLPGVPAPAMNQGMPAAIPEPADFSEPLPWAFELADGEQCTLATGATAAFAGMRINYFCTGGGAILGDPDRTLPVWAVTYLPEGAVASELIEVAVVWH